MDNILKNLVSAYRQVQEAMDPVNKDELKGKHKDRKDKDIDNDGDVDSSDKYLHKRRKAISKAMDEEKCKECDCEMDDCECEDEEKEMKEATATHKGYQDPQGVGLSPSAKAQLANKTPMPDFVDEPSVDAKNFKTFRKSLKVSKKRPGDNDKGDKNVVK